MKTAVDPNVQFGVERVARQGRTEFYEPIATVGGLNLENPADRNTLSDMLGEISEESYRRKGVMLSAVIVTKDGGKPGTGFFALARRLGLHHGDDDLAFWAAELKRVHNAY